MVTRLSGPRDQRHQGRGARRAPLLAGCALSVLLLPALPAAAAATDGPVPFSDADAERVEKAFDAVRKGNPGTALRMRAAMTDPLGRRIVTWFLYLQGVPAGTFADITAFQRDHPDWPVFYKFDQAIERAITPKSDPAAVEAWFAHKPPRTFEGLRDAFTVLMRDGRRAAARDLVRRSWTGILFNLGSQKSVYSLFKRTLDDTDHYARVSDLLQRGKVRHARATMALADLAPSYQAAITAQIQMISKRTRRNVALVLKAISKVPAKLRQDEDFQLALVRWNRRAKRDKEVVRLLAAAPETPPRPDRWWKERENAIRDAIAERKYKLAYHLAASHRQTGADNEARAEFLAGFVALRLVHEPAAAAIHFRRGLAVATSAWDIAQMAYWRGRAAEALGDRTTARAYYEDAARYGNTIYGQLATRRLGWSWISLVTPDGKAPAPAFLRDGLLRTAALLIRIGEKRLAYTFAIRVMQHRARTAAQQRFMVRWITDNFGVGDRRMKTNVRVSKYAQYQGFPLAFDGYPTIDLPAANVAEPALVYALIRQESEFHAAARSWVGARGLMQLMYFTARHEARDNKIPYSLRRLTTDPAYNLRLGTAHVQRLLETFEGAYPLVLAAYNAGAGRVDRWLKDHGDPRTNARLEWIDWIEMIPFNETRNYVKRVLEAVPIYRLKLDDGFDARRLVRYWSAPKRDAKHDCAWLAARRSPQVAETAGKDIAPAALVPTLPTVIRGRRDKAAKRAKMNPSGLELVTRRPHDNIPGRPDCAAK